MISKIVFAVAVDMAQIFCEQRNSGIQREQQRTKETCHLVERDLAHSRESFRGGRPLTIGCYKTSARLRSIMNLQRSQHHQCLDSLWMRRNKKIVRVNFTWRRQIKRHDSIHNRMHAKADLTDLL